jgi:dolichyl-phosphate beta-glucosyltransferase
VSGRERGGGPTGVVAALRHRLRRFAVAGAVVTALDAAVLVALRLGAGLPVVVADAVSVSVAAAASYGLHRAITFADDPHVRWVHQTRLFVAIGAVALAIDVAVLRAAVAVVGSTSLGPLLAAKAVSLLAAGSFRLSAYRGLLMRGVRDEQSRPRPRPPAPGDVRLSVVVPAYREAARIAGTVARLRAALAPLAEAGGYEIVVVDDGSGDRTAAVARRAGADQVVEFGANRGKGAAVRAGVLAARGRTVAFTDADLAYPPEQLLGLLERVEAGWDVVVGSRKHVGTTTLVRARRLRALTSRAFNVLTELVLLGQYRDTQCGLKAFRSDVARLIFSRTRIDRFAFDVEVFHLAERYRLSLTEVPVTLVNSATSTMRLGRDALQMLADLWRIRRWAGRGAYDLDDRDAAVAPVRPG